MKYVKFFEEFGYEETKELIKFCKENLAYLIDDGYKVVIENRNKDLLKISLHKPIDMNNPDWTRLIKFNFSDIKYDFIPFLELLDKRYDIYSYGKESEDKKVMIRTDTILFSRIDELDSLDLDNIKIIEILIKRN
jgi:hypothetical protein